MTHSLHFSFTLLLCTHTSIHYPSPAVTFRLYLPTTIRTHRQFGVTDLPNLHVGMHEAAESNPGPSCWEARHTQLDKMQSYAEDYTAIIIIGVVLIPGVDMNLSAV